MTQVKISEPALYALGMDRVTVNALSHFIRQVGAETGGTTLPQLTEQTDSLKPIIDGLAILMTAAQAALAIVEVEQGNLPMSNNSLLRRLDDAEAAAERAGTDRLDLARAVSEMRDEFGAGYPPAIAETAATIKAKLGITTLSGSNTGDQTLAGLGGASYADGTWTATLITNGAQPASPVTSPCYYTKVGRLVTLQLNIANFTVAGASGNLSVAGLPFPAASSAAIAACWTWNMGATPMVGRIDVSTSVMTLCKPTDNSGIPVTNGAAQYLCATVSYLT